MKLGYRIAKRALDIAGSAAGLVATAPLTIPAAIAIRTTMGSPVLFVQERPGLHGEPFEMYKFRTMRHLRPGEDMLATDGDRITKLGHFLRTTSIDELPALLNVLKGDMSLVGPRPLLMRYLGRYSPRQARRHEVKPGITGWAAIHGRNLVEWDERFELDVWYVDNASLPLDFEILVRTVFKVFQREGISSDGMATMHEFKGANENDVSLVG